MATNKPRVLVTIDEEMEDAIKNFRFSNWFDTQADAVRELLRRGLESVKQEMNLSTPEGLERLRRRIEEEAGKDGNHDHGSTAQ